MSPTGVNLANGAFTYSATDLSVGPLTLERSHVGGKTGGASRYFGPNWTHNYDMYFIVDHPRAPYNYSSVVIGRKTYKFTGDNTYGYSPDTNSVDPDTLKSTLSYSNGNYTFIDKTGTVYTFSSSYMSAVGAVRVASVAYPDGSTLAMTYDAAKNLRTVTSNRGYALVFDYDSGGNVAVACGYNLTITPVSSASTCTGAPVRTSYSYTSYSIGPVLSGFTDVMGQLTSISGSTNVTCITRPASSTCKVANLFFADGLHPNWQVRQQTLADGSVWNFDDWGPPDGRDDAGAPTEHGVNVTDPKGGVMRFEYFDYYPTGYYDQNGAYWKTEAGGTEVWRIVLPEGNQFEKGGNSLNYTETITWTPKPGSQQSAVTRTWTYPSSCANRITCHQPLTVSDYRGNVTSFVYDQTHGGVLSETGPAGSGGIQPVKRSAYVQRYAWISNGAGGYGPAASPIWLLAEERICKATATVGNGCAGGVADEVVTTYDYGPNSGPNNLLLRGVVADAGGLSLRTCYSYDSLGNKISETKPRAGLTSCP